MSTAQAPVAAPANPFAQDVDERLPPPSTLVLFGATGDLAARKLLPAVYDLLADGRLPERFRLLAVVRPNHDEASFRAHAREAIDAHARRPLDERLWDALEPRIGVVVGDHGSSELFDALAARLDAGDEEDGEPSQRLFYLAISPAFFAETARKLAVAGLGRGADPPTRLLIEKPFGHDLASARELNASRSRRRSASGRSSASITTSARRPSRTCWCCASPTASSSRSGTGNTSTTCRSPSPRSIGVGEARRLLRARRHRARHRSRTTCCSSCRWSAMEPPVAFEADAVRDEKVKVLRALRELPRRPRARRRRARPVRRRLGPRRAGARLSRGGGRRRPTRAPRRTRRCSVFIDNWRWAGVPFYLRAGKRLPKRVDRDLDPLPAGAASAVHRADDVRAAAERAGHPHPAGRGHLAEVRLEGARADACAARR